MSILKKNLMYFLVKLGIFAILHFSPFYYKGAECALVIRPQNVAAVSGEGVILNCTSDVAKENIAWSIENPGSSERERIYIGKDLASRVSSYISVSEKDDGSCNLLIKSSVTAAKRYICIERNTGTTASAELIVLENHAACDYNNKTHVLTCFVMFAGNWAPNLECKQWNVVKKESVALEGNKTSAFNNGVVTRTWTYTNNNTSYDIYCSLKFENSERPLEASAMNMPVYNYKILAYHYTTEDHTETIPAAFRTETIPEGSRFHPDGVIVSITLNFVLVVVIVIAVLFMRKKMSKCHEAKKVRGDEDGL